MINWIPQLRANEWPGNVTEQMAPSLFNDIVIPLRKRSGVSMTPSPLIEGHVRERGKSRHSTRGGTRLSDATDIFIPSTRRAVFSILRQAQRISACGGLGLYFDTKPSIMIHVDGRSQRLMWLRIDGEYIYEPNDPVFFYKQLLAQVNRLKP